MVAFAVDALVKKILGSPKVDWLTLWMDALAAWSGDPYDLAEGIWPKASRTWA
jgi:hypothetical protein